MVEGMRRMMWEMRKEKATSLLLLHYSA